MFRSVLVVLDGFPKAESAIPLGHDESIRHQANLVLLLVIPRPEPHPHEFLSHGGPAQSDHVPQDRALTRAEHDAATYLTLIARRFELPASTERVVAVGDPYLRVVDEIRRLELPLVAVATDSTNGQAGHRLCEVAHRLLLLGIAPVLAVTSHPAGEQIAGAETAWLPRNTETPSHVT